jgi:hypothetical protein
MLHTHTAERCMLLFLYHTHNTAARFPARLLQQLLRQRRLSHVVLLLPHQHITALAIPASSAAASAAVAAAA